MDDALERERLIQQILHPKAADADVLLKDLALSGLPSREEVHREIEEKLLLPKGIPEEWLSTYQMYSACRSNDLLYLETDISRAVIGSIRFPSLLCSRYHLLLHQQLCHLFELG